MASRQQKRTRPSSSSRDEWRQRAEVQAYEAVLTYGAADLARDVQEKGGRLGLIEYGGECEKQVWADRHDMVHLLASLPALLPNRPVSPDGSTSSWSLPSDQEEMWYLSDEEEIQAHKDEKRKRWMEALRQDRLREREREDLEAGHVSVGDHGYDDGEVRLTLTEWSLTLAQPPEQIQILMAHTAASLFSSPNPTVLETRIMAHHSTDERFAFLRGKWKTTWEKVKEEVKKKRQDERLREEQKRGLGALGGYESDSEEEDIPPPPPDDLLPPPPPPPFSPV
nr:hypothetical protein L203_02997 [Cryptococcus depauperatus CBS 7841]